ncbi:MAG: VTT domain-containing protein [Deltaproteobacteria bacterium]|nr:VTT domain-containing protein [Deltaproteobacteria bacterium]
MKPEDEDAPLHSLDGTVPPTDRAAPLWRRLLGSSSFWSFLAIGAIVATALYWIHSHGGPTALRERVGWPAAAILVAAQALAGMYPVPAGELLAFANAILHGFWWGMALAWTGWMLAALLQYTLARRMARDVDLEASMRLMPAWVRRFPVSHPAFLILGRLVPGPGPQLVNLAAGALGVPLWRYTWCAAVSILPGAALISGIATGLVEA